MASTMVQNNCQLLPSPNVRTCMTLGDEVFKKKKSIFGEHQTNLAPLIVQEIKI